MLLSDSLPGGSYDALRFFERSESAVIAATDVLDQLAAIGVADPAMVLEWLQRLGLVADAGAGLYLTSLGFRSCLLLEGLNGADLGRIYRRLVATSSARRYTLVRQGMTRGFLRSLHKRPDFRRVYLCSPWINLQLDEQRWLQHAIVAGSNETNGPELLVLTRPEKGSRVNSPAGVTPLRDLGATVFLHRGLHAKLYIREPGINGGYSMAIVGSQNLTRAKYLELGIKIEADDRLIRSLIQLFIHISHHSVELKG